MYLTPLSYTFSHDHDGKFNVRCFLTVIRHTKPLTHGLFPAHNVESHLWCGWKVSVLAMISVANVSRFKQ